ncbi:hypothetical protein BH20ACT18_BH20ACT18_13530 [soil metagenome]
MTAPTDKQAEVAAEPTEVAAAQLGISVEQAEVAAEQPGVPVEQSGMPVERLARDHAYWAKPTPALMVKDVPEGAINRNVDGRRAVSPIQGFGKMWQKTYRIALEGSSASATEVIAEWKQNFPKFWPEKNFFYGPLTGIAPGEVALVNLTMPGRLKLSTGVLVVYADDESFTFMTPQGHMLSGWITFSAYEKDSSTIAQAQVLIRASDPMTELGLIFGGYKKEDEFWCHTLRGLAAHLGARGEVEQDAVCVDKRRQWRNAGNLWQSATIRSGLYAAGTPFRALRRRKPVG